MWFSRKQFWIIFQYHVYFERIKNTVILSSVLEIFFPWSFISLPFLSPSFKNNQMCCHGHWIITSGAKKKNSEQLFRKGECVITDIQYNKRGNRIELSCSDTFP